MIDTHTWQVPSFDTHEYLPKRSRYCVCIPIINEGERIQKQLARMQDIVQNTDVIIGDGNSRDGCTEHLHQQGIRTLLVKTGPGKLSAQLRMLFCYALQQRYEGIVTVDGNNKDGVEAIPAFIEALEAGYAYVQGSRYIKGGEELNTPLSRKLAVKLLHAPLMSLAAGVRYTDTTNGFRAFSREFLLDEHVQPFRDIFDTYNLHFYLALQAAQLKYRVKELPVSRVYPNEGPLPSKIGGLKGNILILKQLFLSVIGAYHPK